jgi:DNA-directed RNA polymerase specialized sigma24 family protein
MRFEEFVAGHPEVLGFAAVLAGDRASAEDIAQETLIRGLISTGTISAPWTGQSFTPAR